MKLTNSDGFLTREVMGEKKKKKKDGSRFLLKISEGLLDGPFFRFTV